MSLEMDRAMPEPKAGSMDDRSASQNQNMVVTGQDQVIGEATTTLAGPSKLRTVESQRSEGSVKTRKKRRKPWGLKVCSRCSRGSVHALVLMCEQWRSSTWYITSGEYQGCISLTLTDQIPSLVVAVGVCSDALAYVSHHFSAARMMLMHTLLVANHHSGLTVSPGKLGIHRSISQNIMAHVRILDRHLHQ